MRARRWFPLYAPPALLALLAQIDAAAAETARVFHVPPADAEVGQPLVLVAEVDRAWAASLEVRYRPADGGPWSEARFQRSDDGYIASIPADVMVPPGIDYFIVGHADGAEATHFASAEAPHRVEVYLGGDVLRATRELELVGGRRARFRIAGEWVDYGSRTLEGRSIADRYYRVEADLTYLLLAYPLHALRFGFTRLEGIVPVTERGAGPCRDEPVEPDADRCALDAGFAGGGWVELRWRIDDRLRIEADTRLMVQATPAGFNIGGRGELRAGDERGSHVALGTEAIADVGVAYFVRLGWATVPRLPMAATVEVTDFPAPTRARGVRLVYDLAYPFDTGLRVGLRLGYQARDQGIGGATLGANAAFEF
jgi:hypothetical protein